ncbi:MAG: hypothetical protein ABI681_11165 [Gemmatimonadales bacterium]
MKRETGSFAYERGQRTDLHIATLREAAENRYGQIFADSTRLRRKLNDPSLTDDEYDAGVVGLVCSTILSIRPMPSFLRGALGGLLGLQTEKRSQLLKVNSPNAGAVEVRSDHVWAELVIEALGTGLYPPGSYLAALTDIGCGLEGVHLTWSRDIIAEAGQGGVIPLQAVQRIRQKLIVAFAGAEVQERAVLLDWQGKPVSKRTGDGASRGVIQERRLKLIELVEHAASIGSPLVCIPSRVREGRIDGQSAA